VQVAGFFHVGTYGAQGSERKFKIRTLENHKGCGWLEELKHDFAIL